MITIDSDKAKVIIQKNLIIGVQQYMDVTAQSYGYDDIKTAVTYADEPVISKFQSEGIAFRKWRSLVWAYCYTQMEAVLRGQRTTPTLEDLILELPTFILEV